MQQAYVNAFLHLGQFEARSRFSTWLTRIAVHEALARARRRNAWSAIGDPAGDGSGIDGVGSPAVGPEEHAYHRELAAIIEWAVATLPDSARAVFMLRDVEGLTLRKPPSASGSTTTR